MRPRTKLEICPKTGKPCYDKKGAITARNRRWKKDRVKLRIYECNYDHWHLTSMKERPNRKPKKSKFNRKRWKLGKGLRRKNQNHYDED
jgi:hypothetical protein